jgi:hypothetical protein
VSAIIVQSPEWLLALITDEADRINDSHEAFNKWVSDSGLIYRDADKIDVSHRAFAYRCIAKYIALTQGAAQ